MWSILPFRSFVYKKVYSTLTHELKPVRCYKAKKRDFTNIERYFYLPNKVYVRETTGDFNKPVVSVTFKFINKIPPMDKVYDFSFDPDSKVGESIERIERQIKTEMKIRYDLVINDKYGLANTSEWSDNDIHSFKITILNESGNPVESKNWKSLIEEADALVRLKLKISRVHHDVILKGPHVKFVELPTTIMVGDDCCPSRIVLENTTIGNCTYKWFKGIPPPTDTESKLMEEIDHLIDWKECGDSYYYSVSKDDIGNSLKIECTPQRDGIIGPILTTFSQCIVVERFGDDMDVFKERHQYTSKRFPMDGICFRLVSYNLLANFYNNKSRLIPYYWYCRPEALGIDYRKKLFIRELRGYNSDIICLQEVDVNVFHNDLKVKLAEDELTGWHIRKGTMQEGLAMFYDNKKFSMIWRGGYTIGQYIDREPYLQELFNQIKDNSPFCNRLFYVPTAVQMTLLKSNTQDRWILIANTHLCAQLDCAHIRLVQVQCILLFIKHVRETILKELNVPNAKVSVIFAGDFNSMPTEGIFQLMTEKTIPVDHKDFRSNEGEALTNVSLSHDYNMASAYAIPPLYTNYTADFKGCLDHIFYETDTVRTVQAVPIHREELLSMETAIPSTYFPSDHIALVADFQWIDN